MPGVVGAGLATDSSLVTINLGSKPARTPSQQLAAIGGRKLDSVKLRGLLLFQVLRVVR
ncbi:hypothetical protein [Chroococcidiopsis sp. SAG 2025]|uniref:hypothetical protein n=1 Tax=Chroococcidiopsis sp. SAG 2025 TaxID=171389 RepID=UPI002937131E|nr:hypothetical protein [Chroococcidiopsis sp. SAG 2025]